MPITRCPRCEIGTGTVCNCLMKCSHEGCAGLEMTVRPGLTFVHTEGKEPDSFHKLAEQGYFAYAHTHRWAFNRHVPSWRELEDDEKEALCAFVEEVLRRA